ncbi:uncharacterized protein LOC130676015 isoform X1 [Microplitis mediator]|uniref:uncharacterized protein LOC130676015 isoform X1 n=2 Tax=Microplitis mediator TaxID=375433 RepID=UPI00255543C9|nr:uncharacterized protein LOC130676015 isoform X1 [Microplitis mediator]XP_057337954.1 uncharacterized protein LOC130676015 isoform X1 [Microplitis mediator]
MGTCFGRCFSNVTDPFTFRYFRHTGLHTQEEEQVELDPRMTQGNDRRRSKKILSFFSLKKLKKRHGGVPVSLELVEDNWKRKSNKYYRLESQNNASTGSDLNTLQTLDARFLLKHPGCISSTPASSLDLEWEHEVIPLPLDDSDRPKSTNDSPSKTSSNGSQPSSLTASPWSKVSTPNSLEWDSVGDNEACVDIETEQLLTEIERLTDKTLKETGEWSGAR